MFSVAERERVRARVLELAASDPRVVDHELVEGVIEAVVHEAEGQGSRLVTTLLPDNRAVHPRGVQKLCRRQRVRSPISSNR